MAYQFKQIVFLILLFLNFSCNFESYNDETISYDIIIVAGQSNTHSGYPIDIESDISNGDVFQLGRFSTSNYTIIPANEPLHHHTINSVKIGFALPFAKLYNKDNNDSNPLLIIPCGWSGTSIRKDWYIDGYLYNDLITRARFILEKFPKSKIKLILWHQGESDVGSQNYDELIDNFIKNIRKDLHKENLPFIVGGMVPYWVKQNNDRIHLQDIIKKTPYRVENTAYADPETPFVIEKDDNSFDEIHYSAEGQRELGKRYFNAYLNLIKNENH